MSGSKKQNYLHGAAIMTVGVIIIKIFGFIYKVPLGNILDDTGYAYFNVAYSIYNVLLTVSTAGLPVALSRLISESDALGRPNQARRYFNVALITFIVLGAAGSLVMFLLPVELADMMHKVEAAQSIKALSPAVLLVCIMSAYRGYTQGHSDMRPTTVSQIIEVGVKVVVALPLAWWLIRSGKSLEIGSAGAVFGVTVGSLAAVLYIYVVYRRNRRYYEPAARSDDVPDRAGAILGKLIKVGVPIALGSSVLSLITLIDTNLVLMRLQGAAGFTDDASSVLFGVYSKAMTLFNLPAALVTPLTISIIPAISACVAERKRREATDIAESTMRIATIVGLPMGVGLTVLAYPVMNVLYWGSAPQGPGLLTLMGVVSYFVCMALIMTAVLQAYGAERLPIYAMLAGGVIKIGVNWILVGNPDINIYGAPIGTLCCYIVMCVMDYVFIARGKRVEGRPSLRKVLVRPVVSSAAMGAAAWAVYGLAARVLSSGGELDRVRMCVAMLAAVCVAVAVYLVMIIATRAVTAEDMRLMPKGEKLAKILHIR